MGKDSIPFNAHRIYGRYRWQLILKLGWEVLDVFYEGGDVVANFTDPSTWNRQPIVVLRKI